MTGLDPFTAIRFQRGAEHLHRLGARATAEFSAEVAGRTDAMPCIVDLLGRYRRHLTPELVQALGGDRFPPHRPLLVPGNAP